jgi:hypothetical protein
MAISMPDTALYNPAELCASRAAVAAKEPWAIAATTALRRNADTWLRQPPGSVMQKTVTPPSQNKHDYMSLDKYYWPCNAPPPKIQGIEEAPDPMCASGAKDGLVCCLAKCRTCGGHGCADEPGGKPGCCVSNIKAANRSCSNGPPPCIINPHDNCDKATGLPWQRHDGITNPQIIKYDHDRLINMTSAVTELANAHFFTGDPRYAVAAVELLRTWFLNPATAQNPTSGLSYGHFIPGVSNGSHGAVIDIHSWPELLDGVSMLRQSPTSGWTAKDDGGLIRWFTVFLNWLVGSPLGVQEMQATNNHGVWYDVQVLAIARFVRNRSAFDAAVDRATKRVENQIRPNGTMPAELARTKSWSYSQFCLNAFFHVGTLVRSWPPGDVDLWTYATPSGSSVRRALDWQFQYLGPAGRPWPYQQIDPFTAATGAHVHGHCHESWLDDHKYSDSRLIDLNRTWTAWAQGAISRW